MSKKVATFLGLITQPLNNYNFIVKIPGLENEDITLVVESTTFPSEKLRVVELWHQGEKIRYPGIPENDGSWKITVPENDKGDVRKNLDRLKVNLYDQKTGILTPPTAAMLKDIEVFARDTADNIVFSVILHGTWIRGRDPHNLSATDPTTSWKWDYEFVYQWIEDSKL